MASTYQRMSILQKRARDLARVREPAVPCPGGCGVQLMAADLLSHLSQRCPGPSAPGPTAKWVTWREALVLGAAPMQLSRWTRRGNVRSRGGRGDREYLLGDLQLQLAKQLVGRRR
jgi:hypothetical protein